MIQLIAKGYIGKQKLYLWREGHYRYKIEEFTQDPMRRENAYCKSLNCGFEDALEKLSNTVDGKITYFSGL